MIVYMVTSPSGKRYIGITKKALESRKKEHIKYAKLYNRKFSKAILKYGDKLTWEVVDTGETYEELFFKEKEYIRFYDTYKNGYNSTLGGDGTCGEVVGKANSKKIIHNNFQIYPSLVKASKTLNLSCRHIGDLLKTGRTDPKGNSFKFYYKEDEKRPHKPYDYSSEAWKNRKLQSRSVIDTNGNVYKSVKEAAEICKIGRRTIHSLLKNRNLHRFLKIGFSYVG